MQDNVDVDTMYTLSFVLYSFLLRLGLLIVGLLNVDLPLGELQYFIDQAIFKSVMICLGVVYCNLHDRCADSQDSIPLIEVQG
jgi:uncharacterized membrane protein YiaA